MANESPKVVLIDYDEDLFSPQGFEGRMLADAGITWQTGQWHTPEEVVEVARDADVVLVHSLRRLLTRSVIQKVDRPRCLVRLGIGYDTIDVEAATERGVLVCNVPTYCVEDVAEHALALLLACVRRVPLQDRSIRDGNWERSRARPSRRLKGATMGFVAFGRIARALAQRVAGFGLTLLAYDPHLGAAAITQSGAAKVDLSELVARSDFISVHAPLTPETFHLLGGAEFAQMKDGVFIVNTSRGAVIDETALVGALRSGKVWGAGLDVMECEPLPSDSPLRQFENVVLTPHVGANSEESVAELYRTACEIAIDVIAGRHPHGVVNPEVAHRTNLGARRTLAGQVADEHNTGSRS